ncbi:MAG: helix-turn-helix transcriptional regulator [Bacteroidota bacterium]
MLKNIEMDVDAQLKNVADNIKERRIRLHLSQSYMARALGITQNAYSKIETAKTKMSLERLYEIAEILNVKPKQLIASNIITMHSHRKVG